MKAKPFWMDQKEKCCLMRGLYAVFSRDKKLATNDARKDLCGDGRPHLTYVEKKVLSTLGTVLEVSEGEFSKNRLESTKEVAEIINLIRDSRIRIYFLRIIHDVNLEDERSVVQLPKWLRGEDNFNAIYAQLVRQIAIPEHTPPPGPLQSRSR